MFYVFCSAFSYLFQNLSNKEFSRRLPCRLSGLALLDALSFLIIACVSALLGGAVAVPVPSWGLILLFSLDYTIAIFLIVAAMSTGPFGLTSLIINMSMMISVVLGPILWKEVITVPRILGILCMCGVVALSTAHGPRSAQKQSARWIVTCLLALVSNGLLGVLKKTYFYRFPEVSSVAFVFWSFACAALMCGVVVVFSALRGERFHDWLGKSQVFFPCALGIGLGSAGGNIFQVMALRQLDAMVLYPLAQGTIVIALWISACVFYHEPTRTSGFLALALGMVGIVLLGFF